MDQSKTDIPHIITNPKVIAGAYKLETHVTGVRVHGRFTMMFLDCGQFSHDSNLTIEVLLQVFSQLKVFDKLYNTFNINVGFFSYNQKCY